jgi:hypothetical protein
MLYTPEAPMPSKTRDTIRPESRSKGPGETETFEQLSGSTDPRSTNRRNERMPHERDESAKATGNRLDQPAPPSEAEISQAHDDAESDQVDTDRRGVPNDVPGSKANRSR